MTKRRSKTPLAEGGGVTLTKAQQRAVVALAAQRRQIMDDANEALGEIGEALKELAQLYARKAGMPEVEQYDFVQRGKSIVLVQQKEPQEEKREEKKDVKPDGGD